MANRKRRRGELRTELLSLAQTMTMAQAASKVGVSRQRVYQIANAEGVSFVEAQPKRLVTCPKCDRVLRVPEDDFVSESVECAAHKWTPKALKALRHKLKLTQDALAYTLGAGSATTTRWENGTHRPSPRYMVKLEALEEAANA